MRNQDGTYTLTVSERIHNLIQAIMMVEEVSADDALLRVYNLDKSQGDESGVTEILIQCPNSEFAYLSKTAQITGISVEDLTQSLFIGGYNLVRLLIKGCDITIIHPNGDAPSSFRDFLKRMS